MDVEKHEIVSRGLDTGEGVLPVTANGDGQAVGEEFLLQRPADQVVVIDDEQTLYGRRGFDHEREKANCMP